jgi:hypothetical protein
MNQASLRISPRDGRLPVVRVPRVARDAEAVVVETQAVRASEVSQDASQTPTMAFFLSYPRRKAQTRPVSAAPASSWSRTRAPSGQVKESRSWLAETVASPSSSVRGKRVPWTLLTSTTPPCAHTQLETPAVESPRTDITASLSPAAVIASIASVISEETKPASWSNRSPRRWPNAAKLHDELYQLGPA